MARKGLTLLETLIALSITLVLASVIIAVFGQGWRMWRAMAGTAERQQVKELVAERICREIRGASEILAGSSSAELVVKTKAGVLRYSLAAGKVKRRENSYTAYFTNEGEIQKLSFAYFPPRGVQVAVDDDCYFIRLRNCHGP